MQKPVHYDLVSSLLRYGQFHLAIIDTDDLLNLAQKSNKNMSKAARKRYEHINKATPYLPSQLDPKCGTAEFESTDCGYSSQTSVTMPICRKIWQITEWEQRDPPIHPLSRVKDLEVKYAWVEGMDDPLSRENTISLYSNRGSWRRRLTPERSTRKTVPAVL
jgi:hypothetical protein